MISREKIEKQFGSVIFEFEIPHIGWELDSKVWICEKDGKRKLVLSDHGKPYVASVAELSENVNSLNDVIIKMNRAIEYLK